MHAWTTHVYTYTHTHVHVHDRSRFSTHVHTTTRQGLLHTTTARLRGGQGLPLFTCGEVKGCALTPSHVPRVDVPRRRELFHGGRVASFARLEQRRHALRVSDPGRRAYRHLSR